jgi:hypothetical protein
MNMLCLLHYRRGQTMTGMRLRHKGVHIEGRRRGSENAQDNDDARKQRKIYGSSCFRLEKLRIFLSCRSWSVNLGGSGSHSSDGPAKMRRSLSIPTAFKHRCVTVASNLLSTDANKLSSCSSYSESGLARRCLSSCHKIVWS